MVVGYIERNPLLSAECKLFIVLPGIDHSHIFVQTKAEKEEYLEMIKTGHLNIIVGTHSLLGSRVVYSNLGLLVVDEEQVLFYLVENKLFMP